MYVELIERVCTHQSVDKICYKGSISIVSFRNQTIQMVTAHQTPSPPKKKKKKDVKRYLNHN